MNPNRPAYTITTNSSHVGSDFKIHPWENRVISILECADLQTVPRFYDWTRARENGTTYLIRNLVGEAFPTYFTYLHGRVLSQILSYSESSSPSNGRGRDATAALGVDVPSDSVEDAALRRTGSNAGSKGQVLAVTE